MLLKRITMSGFKSFADKVEFEFSPGVTAIVGPNGCGKSNVVDSFKWVLGEQSARSLRGRQMTDMIFNGASNRKSASMAQVDLVFDNTDRTLPIDRDEVSVSRKLYRSGESEYMVCKEPGRLKDIREMFMDTGIGTNAYAIIEQGKVESLLHSSATERRIIFEEAAGISKYRARKREAERKLGRTEQNLLRVADIIEEVEKRLRSVKLQAGKARNFKEYEARYRELRASFSMAEYHRFSEEILEIQGKVDGKRAETVEIRQNIENGENESVRLNAQAESLAEEIANCDGRLVRVRAEVTANEERSAAAEMRIEEQEINLQRAEGRLAQEKARYQEQCNELDEVQEQAQSLQRATQEQNDRIDKLSRQDQELVREITQTQATLEDEKAGIFDLVRRTSQLHNEINSLAKHAESLKDQKGRLSERGAAIVGELEGEVTRRAALEAKLAEVEELIAEETTLLEEKKEAARQIDAQRAELTEKLATEKEDRSALRSRRQVLADLQKRREGIGAGARQILDQRILDEEGTLSLSTVLGLVADQFETDLPRAKIVEAAIGENDQQLVVADSKAFLADPQLVANLPERTTIICLDRLSPVGEVQDFSDQPGFVSTGKRFVRYAENIELLADNLLGKTVVVDTLSNALEMARNDDNGCRFVTLNGEVVEPSGQIRLGPPESHAGLISRQTELRTIDEQLHAIEQKIGELADELNRRSAQTTQLEKVQQELRTSIYELHTAKVETNAILNNVNEAIRRLTAEQPLIADEVASIEHELDEAARRVSDNKESASELEQTSVVREQNVVKFQEKIDELTQKRASVVEELTQTRVAVGQLMEKRTAAAETINALRRGIRAAEEGVEAADREMSDCRLRIAESEQAVTDCQEKLASLRQDVERVEAEAAELRSQREELRTQILNLSEQVRKFRTNLEEAERQLHERQMTLHEAGIHRDELESRVREELGMELAELYNSYEHDEQNWQEVESEIAELKQKMGRLGNINLDAIQEQEELEERQVFLTSQRDDLDESRKQLDNLIEQLNEESRKRFTDVFFAIRDNFRELFRKLFGGGKADIILEDPTDILETGIEILARPPGKEQQSITLMSGGEKSMTAIALLMSIFRSRPSPFAILDEVDAALDEANNERFNGIIREFLDRSQFIVISHSKRTMSIADQMYGVTMQEPGISTRVSVKFEQVDDVSSAVA